MNLDSNYFYKEPICQEIQCNLLTLYTKRKYGYEVKFKYNSDPAFKRAVEKAIKYLNNKNKQDEKTKNSTKYRNITINS